MFIDYYNKLVHTLLDCNLFHYFVSEYIISLTDHEEITKPTTLSVVAVEFLLNRISVLLQSSTCHECFHKVLAIMENHGNIATEKLSREIRVKLAETREIVNSYTGRYNVLLCSLIACMHIHMMPCTMLYTWF